MKSLNTPVPAIILSLPEINEGPGKNIQIPGGTPAPSNWPTPSGGVSAPSACRGYGYVPFVWFSQFNVTTCSGAVGSSKVLQDCSHGRRASFEQFTLTLLYAGTGFKAQGQTMLHGTAPNIQRPALGMTPSASLYLQLSRVTSLHIVLILGPFDIAELRTPLSDELFAELVWEEEIACNTKCLYHIKFNYQTI